MPAKKEAKLFKPLPDAPMRVSPDGSSVQIGSQRFKRTVLPSVATAKLPEPELDVLDDDESTISTVTTT